MSFNSEVQGCSVHQYYDCRLMATATQICRCALPAYMKYRNANWPNGILNPLLEMKIKDFSPADFKYLQSMRQAK